MGMPDRFNCFKSKMVRDFMFRFDARMCELEKAEIDLKALKEPLSNIYSVEIDDDRMRFQGKDYTSQPANPKNLP